MQGEEKVLELMGCIGSEIAYKRGKGTKLLVPNEKKILVSRMMILPNLEPIGFLFFMKQGKFDTAIVGWGLNMKCLYGHMMWHYQ